MLNSKNFDGPLSRVYPLRQGVCLLEKSMFKTVILYVAGIIGIVALAFVLELGGLQWNKFFAPKHENVRREVFKSTRSFNEAKVQELVKYRLEYMRAEDDAEKGAIASTIRLGFADYDASKLPEELQAFFEEIKYK